MYLLALIDRFLKIYILQV